MPSKDVVSVKDMKDAVEKVKAILRNNGFSGFPLDVLAESYEALFNLCVENGVITDVDI